jgi:macrolide-specific efflux system membrane fusion protein
MALNKKIIISVVSLIIVVTGIYYFYKKSDAPKFQEVVVASGKIAITISATGTVQPENRLEIKAPIAGRAVEVLVKEGEAVKKGQILAWMSSTERAALLDAARASGSQELKRWEQLYRPTPIIAPIDGVIILKSIEAGQTFSNTDAIFVLSNRLTIKAQVDETDMAQITTGKAANITLDAYPKQLIEATVGAIAYEARTVNNVTTYLIDVTPKSEPDFMRSGMTAAVVFNIEEKDNIILLPNAAINWELEEPRVLVKKARGQEFQVVKVGISDGKFSEALEGVSLGDTLLIVSETANKNKSGSSSPFGIPSRKR